MALRTLNPPVSSRHKPPSPLDYMALFQLPRRRSDRLPPLPAVKNRGGTRIAAGKGGFRCLGAGAGDGARRGGAPKGVDLATLGNLCVDIVLGVPSLPPTPPDERRAYMEQLAASPPDKKYWEAGGNCNLAIAAARLGLHVATLGHVGDEIYGHFLLDVLQDECISIVGMNENTEATVHNSFYETLLCWVLVDPFQKHGFCSRADFSDEPAFNWISKLPGQVKMAIQQSKILFCNGYAFDELLPNVIISALNCAIDAGTAVFFDPGPRGRSLHHGTPEEQRALNLFLRLSDVLLLTSDEAESLTGITNPIRAGLELIRKGVRTKWVIIKMGSKGSILITQSIISCAPAFKVNVVDTVGCGDSFTAAIAFGFLHDLPAVNSLALANAVGAATATGCGAGRNVARLDKVLELLRQADLNENDELWNELIEGNLETKEVRLLSRASINGCSGCLVRYPIYSVVSELLSKFEGVYKRSIMHS
ncbi:probable fructokinase-1 [Phoenix dactylifera]|uniref:Probable fructokinase-1 n=1 Tax=Phoenix dactylifera TaxID=42345 RepID=A0A8B7CTK4_PHODC|nr:probable fructokinase-1 [Phoenix dactylifera]